MKSQVLVTKKRVLACTRVDDLLITATGNTPIDNESWVEFCESCASIVREFGPYPGLLTWAPHHGPSAAQRKTIAEKYGEAVRVDQQRRLALVSGSTFVRGIVTAMSWLRAGNMGVLAFSPDAVEEAFTWLSADTKFRLEEAREGLAKVRRALE